MMWKSWPAPACAACNDIRSVRTDRAHRKVVTCPRCSDPSKRPDMELEAYRQNYGRLTITVGSLSAKEQEWFRDFGAAGLTELDALRSIEGRRYDPLKDDEFLKEAREEFRKWRLGRDSGGRKPPDGGHGGGDAHADSRQPERGSREDRGDQGSFSDLPG